MLQNTCAKIILVVSEALGENVFTLIQALVAIFTFRHFLLCLVWLNDLIVTFLRVTHLSRFC